MEWVPYPCDSSEPKTDQKELGELTMPMLQVSILEGRTPEQKEELINRLTATITETLSVKPESVRVLIQEMPKTNWGIAGQRQA